MSEPLNDYRPHYEKCGSTRDIPYEPIYPTDDENLVNILTEEEKNWVRELRKRYEYQRSIQDRHTGIPEILAEEIDRYGYYHIPPESEFVRAIITGDLFIAVALADEKYRDRIADIVEYICYKHNPLCWGSVTDYDLWIQQTKEDNHV